MYLVHIGASRESIEKQLEFMQKQLNEIKIIPMQIQTTLAFLTKALEQVAPALKLQCPIIPNMNGKKEEPEEDESDFAIKIQDLFDESCVLDVVPKRDYELEEESEYETDEEDDLDQEYIEWEMERQRKMERLEKLERSWPWKETQKTIYR